MTSHKTTARKIQSHVGITLKLQDLRLADIYNMQSFMTFNKETEFLLQKSIFFHFL